MCMFSGKCSMLVLVIVVVIVMLGWVVVLQVSVVGFIDDLILIGGIYYWQCECDCKDVIDGDKYKINFFYFIWNVNLDFQFGYVVDMFGFDIVVFIVIEMVENGDSGYLNEIVFLLCNKVYDEDYFGDKSGISLYKVVVKFKYGLVWVCVGYIQLIGQILLVLYWSFMSGIYQGVEVGVNFDYGMVGVLSFFYMWMNEYKVLWYIEMDDFYQNDKKIKVDYFYFVGVKYDFKNDLVLEVVFGQVQGYIDQYFVKVSYKFDVVGVLLSISYQFYGICDKVSNGGVNDIYDGIVWLQVLIFGYKVVDVLDLCFEGIWVKVDGQQGYFLQCMILIYVFFNGCFDIWWDNCFDFNVNGEKVVFFGVMYDMKNWDMLGWVFGVFYVYVWDVKLG